METLEVQGVGLWIVGLQDLWVLLKVQKRGRFLSLRICDAILRPSVMRHLLSPVLHEGAGGSGLLASSEVVLLVVLDKRALRVSVPITAGVTVGLRSPVLVVQDHIGVSIDALDADAETVRSGSVAVRPGGAGRLRVDTLRSTVGNASHSVRIHQDDRRNTNPSPQIRWPTCAASKHSDNQRRDTTA